MSKRGGVWTGCFQHYSQDARQSHSSLTETSSALWGMQRSPHLHAAPYPPPSHTHTHTLIPSQDRKRGVHPQGRCCEMLEAPSPPPSCGSAPPSLTAPTSLLTRPPPPPHSTVRWQRRRVHWSSQVDAGTHPHAQEVTRESESAQDSTSNRAGLPWSEKNVRGVWPLQQAKGHPGCPCD